MGLIIKKKEKDVDIIQIVLYMKENGRMIKKKEEEFIII